MNLIGDVDGVNTEQKAEKTSAPLVLNGTHSHPHAIHINTPPALLSLLPSASTTVTSATPTSASTPTIKPRILSLNALNAHDSTMHNDDVEDDDDNGTVWESKWDDDGEPNSQSSETAPTIASSLKEEKQSAALTEDDHDNESGDASRAKRQKKNKLQASDSNPIMKHSAELRHKSRRSKKHSSDHNGAV